jgi:DNA-binding transcriptional LysR family regulator
MITRFMVEYPKVEVLLESTNRRVDVIREGFDLAVRVRFPPLDVTDLVIRKLTAHSAWPRPSVICGSGGGSFCHDWSHHRTNPRERMTS